MIDAIEAERLRWEREELPCQIHEAVFVCDNPIDRSAEVLVELSQASDRDWIRVLHLSQNYGQHPATVAGLLHACGEWVATLDEDLQHHPQFLERMLRHAATTGSDIVYGRPESSVHESAYRDLSSRLYKRLVARLAGNPHIVHFSSFRLMRGSVARAAASVATHDTYFDIALTWYTDKIDHLDLPLKDQRYIRTGQSGYSFRRLVSHARRMLANSQVKVLRAGALMGLLAVLLAFSMQLIYLIVWLVDEQAIAVRGWLSTFSAILFFGGLNAMLVGIALEHLSIILLKAQGKPSFFLVDRSRDRVLRECFASPPSPSSTPTPHDDPSPAPAAPRSA